MEADSPVSKLVVLGQQIGENYRWADQVKAGETAFQLVRRKVEDTDSLESAIRYATHGMDVPRQPGFITCSRRARPERETPSYVRWRVMTVWIYRLSFEFRAT